MAGGPWGGATPPERSTAAGRRRRGARLLSDLRPRQQLVGSHVRGGPALRRVGHAAAAALVDALVPAALRSQQRLELRLPQGELLLAALRYQALLVVLRAAWRRLQ